MPAEEFLNRFTSPKNSTLTLKHSWPCTPTQHALRAENLNWVTIEGIEDREPASNARGSIIHDQTVEINMNNSYCIVSGVEILVPYPSNTRVTTNWVQTTGLLLEFNGLVLQNDVVINFNAKVLFPNWV